MSDEQNMVPPAADEASDPAAAWRWTREFWDEPDEEGQQLIRVDMLIEGTIAILEGHYEAGKTALMMDMERRWIEDLNRPVFHFDYEMGRRRVRKRMKANLWTPDDLELYHYDYMPNLQPGLLEQVVAMLPPQPLISLDSYSAAMMYLGREENSATEAGNWWVGELQRARDEFGATILVNDQVKQNATARDRYAGRGSGSKSFNADVKWFIERFEKFSPTQSGVIKATLRKDREGVLPEELGFRVGDGMGHLTVEATDPPRGTPVDDTAVSRVEDVLRDEGWLTVNAIKTRIEGYGYDTIRSAVAWMEARGIVTGRPRAGKGGGYEYALNTDDQAADVPSLD